MRPAETTPVGQPACPQRRRLGENLAHSLQGPRKRRDGGFFSPGGTALAEQRGSGQALVPCVTQAGGGQ